MAFRLIHLKRAGLFLVGVGILLGLSLAAMALSVKWAVRESLEIVFHQPVVISRSQLSLRPLSLTFSSIKVYQTVCVDTLQIQIRFWPLLSGKWIVDSVAFSGVREFQEMDLASFSEVKPGTSRGESAVGSLLEKAANSTAKTAKSVINPALTTSLSGSLTSVFQNSDLRPESILNSPTSRTAQSIQNVRSTLSRSQKEFEAYRKSNPLERSKRDIQADINSLNQDIASLTQTKPLKLTLSSAHHTALKSALNTARSLQDELNSTIQATQSELNQRLDSLTRLEDTVQLLGATFASDVDQLVKGIHVSGFSGEDLGRQFLSQPARLWVDRLAIYWPRLMSLVASLKDASSTSELATRSDFSGITLAFPDSKAPLPSFLIKSIHISGTWSGRSFLGQIQSVSSQSNVLDTPIQFQFKSTSVSSTSTSQSLPKVGPDYSLFGAVDTRVEPTRLYLHVEVSQLDASRLMPVTSYTDIGIESGTAKVMADIELEGLNVQGQYQFLGQSLVFSNASPSESGSSLIVNVLNARHEFPVSGKVNGSLLSPSITLSSPVLKEFQHLTSQLIRQEQLALKSAVIQEGQSSLKAIQTDFSSTISQLKTDQSAYFKSLQSEFEKLKKSIKLPNGTVAK